jgi:hypothetical protein
MAFDLLTTTQVMEILKRDHRSVRRLIDNGRLPVEVTLPGERGAMLFRPDDVRKLARELADELMARMPVTDEVA